MAGENLTKLKIDNVVKEYVGNKGKTVALNGVSLDIKENEFICVVGPPERRWIRQPAGWSGRRKGPGGRRG